MSRIVILFLSVFITFSAQAEVAPISDSTQTNNQDQLTLPNGMRVVVQSVPWERLVSVEVFYNAGAATDPDSLAGLAHLAEHLLTESGHLHPDGELIRLQTLYSTYSNAYTGNASMVFVTNCLPEFLDEVLDLEVDRMHGATTDSLSFEREKSVVLEEISFRSRMSPEQEFSESIFQTSFPNHPYGRSVGGSQASVNRVRLEDFQAFQTNHINPEKAAIVISGPVDIENAMSMVQSKFNFGEPSKPFLPKPLPYPPMKAAQVILDATDHSGYLVGMACRIPLQDDLDLALAYTITEFLNSTWLALGQYSVPGEAVFMASLSGDYFIPPTDPEQQYGRAFPEPDPDQDAQRALGRLWEELGETIDDLQSPDSFEEAQNRVLKSLGRQSETSYSGSGIGQALINGNRFLDPTALSEIIGAATPADLNSFASRFLIPDRAVVGVSHGQDSGRPATIDMTGRVAPTPAIQASDRMELLGKDLIEPVLQVYRHANLFQFEKTTLSNGTPVHCLVIPDADRWYFSCYRAFSELKELRTDKMPGLDILYNQVVDFDSTQRRHPDYPEPPRELPYNLSFYLNPWSLYFSADGSPDRADKISQTISKRIKSREFNTGRWASVLHWAESSLNDVRDRKTNAAAAWRWGQVLGTDHPYLGKFAPNPETGSSVKYKDLQKLHSKVTGKTGHSIVVATGPLGAKAVKNVLKNSLGRNGEWKYRFDFTQAEENFYGARGKIFHAPERGDVRLTLTFPPRGNQHADDRLGTTVFLLKTALTQSLESKLRHQEGLTYSVFCRAKAIGDKIIWEVEVTCQPGQAPLALASLKKELARCSREGFTEDEWALARLELVSLYIDAFADARDGRNLLMSLASFGEVPNNPMTKVFDIKLSAINNMVKRVIDGRNFVFTATGPMFEEDIDQF